ncbi:MAG: serine/threonine protein kinase [Myxococcales bacterium]|nr:serine/threonine protein kinase [Myxococcales bacterium]
MKRVHPRAIGAFEIIAHLDTGGMAHVYLSRRLGDASILGVTKILKAELADDENAMRGMAQEGRIMARLRHPNVVRLYEHGTAQGLPFITMEYLFGENLSALRRAAARRGLPLSPSLVARILLQASNALEYIHGLGDESGRPLGLVHRDISPQNLLCTYAGQVKLLDFGIALSPDREVKTGTGLIKGKLCYMSPEQVQGLALDGKSDIFSLGIVGWELLAGRPLFRAESEYKTMRLICEDSIPDVRQERPDLPEPLVGTLMRCLERDRDLRPTAGQLRAALSEWLFAGSAGSPREIERFAAEILSDKKSRREQLIGSLRQSEALREYLFQDLDSEPGEDASHTPSQPSVHVAFSSLSPQPEPPSAAPAVASRAANPKRRRWHLAGAGVGVVALIVTFWLAGGTPDRHTVSAAPDSGDAVDAGTTLPQEQESRPPQADASVPVGASGSDEAAHAGSEAVFPLGDAGPDEARPDGASTDGDGPAMGFLRVRTRPPLDAFLDDRYLGQTPIEDLELLPGSYRLLLQDAERRTRRSLTVRIRPGEISSFQFIF